MRAYVLSAIMLLASGSVLADELGDANKALETKSYPVALQLYQKLAAAGNAEAQFHLGEMHWYGEGVAQDDAQARQWFSKSAAAGSKDAAAALQTMDRRKERRADIDYWVQKYDGSDLRSGKYYCPQPAFPAESSAKDDIKAMVKSFADWQACYNSAADQLNALLPPGKAIPKDVADLMNQREWDAAVGRLDKVYAGLMAEQAAQARVTQASFERWHKATEVRVEVLNRQVRLTRERANNEWNTGQFQRQTAPQVQH